MFALQQWLQANGMCRSMEGGLDWWGEVRCLLGLSVP